jgi:histone deacetylase complex regulatory component SIN3
MLQCWPADELRPIVRRINIPQVKERVLELFKDHPLLIPGFNVFLNADNVNPLPVGPPEPVVQTPTAPPVPPVPSSLSQEAAANESKNLDVTDALSYLDLVKAQFESSPAIFNK